MKSLVELSRIWPELDELDKQTFRDFFARWTHSWLEFSRTMDQTQKSDLLSKLDEELSRKLAGLRQLYEYAGSSLSASKSSPQNTEPSVPPELQQYTKGPQAAATAEARGLIDVHGWTNVQTAYDWLIDDHSHGDWAISEAASELNATRGGAAYGRSDNTLEFVRDAVIRGDELRAEVGLQDAMVREKESEYETIDTRPAHDMVHIADIWGLALREPQSRGIGIS